MATSCQSSGVLGTNIASHYLEIVFLGVIIFLVYIHLLGHPCHSINIGDFLRKGFRSFVFFELVA